MKKVKELLNQISGIVKKYDEIVAITGEGFNIFNILGVSTAEVKLHSNLIAELLNPKGSHGMKDVFLRLFLKHLDKNELTPEFITENVNVLVEKWVGFIDKENDTGGYIDIFIQLPNREIIIENKIFAGDQEGQLRRYHNYNKSASLVYLTLDGKEAGDFTTKNVKYQDSPIKPKPISYQSDVIDWLEQCRKEAVNHPLIRETITQYIHLIKNLTGQTLNNDMETEILKVITDRGENVKSALAIAGSIKEIKMSLLMKFAKELVARVKAQKPMVSTEISENFGKKWEGVTFKLPSKNEFVFFSFLTDGNYSYLEIGNTSNVWEDNMKKVNSKNIEYYTSKLNEVAMGWGSVEDTESAWHGDWVCKYEKKMDVWMRDNQFWIDLADNECNDKFIEVTRDIIELLDVIENKE